MKKSQVLADTLKALRLKSGLNQREMGEALELSMLYKSPPGRVIYYYESGRRIPAEVVLQRYADYFMLDIKYLIALICDDKIEKQLDNCQTELGRFLRKLRLDAGLSMRKMVLKLSISDFYPSTDLRTLTSMMYLWEVGKRHLKEEVLQRYCEVFDVSLRDGFHRPHRTGFIRSDPGSVSETTYYFCTQRDSGGLPTHTERHIYDETGELKRIEKRTQ